MFVYTYVYERKYIHICKYIYIWDNNERHEIVFLWKLFFEIISFFLEMKKPTLLYPKKLK